MRVLVTGGTGSVGEPIVQGLVDAGHDVVSYAASAPSGPFPARFVQGDILDLSRLRDVVDEVRPAAVIHAAAVTPDRATEAEHAHEILEVNLIGALRALRAFASAQPGRFLYVSSVAAYGDAAEGAAPLRETIDDGRPRTLYELSKQSAERAILRVAALDDLDVACLRLGDVFGPGERATPYRTRMSGPLQVTALAAAGEPVRLPEDGTREWTYTGDVASAVLTAVVAREPLPAVLNVGSGRSWSLLDWCAHLRRRWPAVSVSVDPDAANVVLFAKNAPLCTARASSLGFTAAWDLERAFDDYMRWWDSR
jgi:nucleoside-diphosphate-sugar epimerase